MLSNIYRQHTERISTLKQKQGFNSLISFEINSISFDLFRKKKKRITFICWSIRS